MQYKVGEILPNYCPKIDESTGEARDLDLSEMRREYPNGFKCCGNDYLVSRYSTCKSTHMKTAKHKSKVIEPATKEYKENLGDCDTPLEGFQKKCKENRELKKIIVQKQMELDKVKIDKDRAISLNLEYQEKLKELQKKIKPIKVVIKEQNLIDM